MAIQKRSVLSVDDLCGRYPSFTRGQIETTLERVGGSVKEADLDRFGEMLEDLFGDDLDPAEVSKHVDPSVAVDRAQNAAMEYATKFYNDVAEIAVQELDHYFDPLKQQIAKAIADNAKRAMMGTLQQIAAHNGDCDNYLPDGSGLGKYKVDPNDTSWLTVPTMATPMIEATTTKTPLLPGQHSGGGGDGSTV